jgi:hypothetical protein
MTENEGTEGRDTEWRDLLCKGDPQSISQTSPLGAISSPSLSLPPADSGSEGEGALLIRSGLLSKSCII